MPHTEIHRAFYHLEIILFLLRCKSGYYSVRANTVNSIRLTSLEHCLEQMKRVIFKSQSNDSIFVISFVNIYYLNYINWITLQIFQASKFQIYVKNLMPSYSPLRFAVYWGQLLESDSTMIGR